MAIELKSAPPEGYSREYYLQRGNAMFQAEARHLLAACRLENGSRLLEVGCGGGGLLQSRIAMATAGLTAGVDVNGAALSLARPLAPGAALALADAACLPFAGGCFEAVVAQHVIEHFEHPDVVLQEWSRVLAPGGRVVVATPNALYPDPALFDDATHRKIYTLDGLKALFTRNGFDIEHAYSLMPFLASRRITWRLARVSMRSLLATRFLPGLSDRGLTLILAARKGVSTL